MRKTLPVDDLARDERFVKINIEEVIFDPRGAVNRDDRRTGFNPDDPDSPDGARGLMHGIFVGDSQALEGLAIDVFNTMREYGSVTGDPVLEFCEDWMLADEVTHVKMGSDWLRRITANDKERQQEALEFQRTIDKLFSFGGFRGESDDS